jgi:hypothetical protein
MPVEGGIIQEVTESTSSWSPIRRPRKTRRHTQQPIRPFPRRWLRIGNQGKIAGPGHVRANVPLANGAITPNNWGPTSRRPCARQLSHAPPANRVHDPAPQ